MTREKYYHRIPEINSLITEHAALVEKIRVAAVANNAEVTLELPGSYHTVSVLTQDYWDQVKQYFESDTDQFEVGQWVSSSDFC